MVTAADIPSIAVTQDYFSIFHATASKIGLLGELGGPITRLYTLGKALIEDLGVFRKWHDEPVYFPERAWLRNTLEQERALFETIQDEGRKLVGRLDHYASRRHRWFGLIP